MDSKEAAEKALEELKFYLFKYGNECCDAGEEHREYTAEIAGHVSAILARFAELEANAERFKGVIVILENDIAELAAKVPRWIPVGERLPVTEGPVLTSILKRFGKRQYKFMMWRDGGFVYARNQIRGRQVTHWMPPPTPAIEKSTPPGVIEVTTMDQAARGEREWVDAK